MRISIQDRRLVSSLACALALAGCEAGGLPSGWRATPPGSGARVVWDFDATPLPEIPLPNDVATTADPASPTGRRLNASLVAATQFESDARTAFAELDGWGTSAAISVRFEAPLDLANLIDRQGASRFSTRDFARHAVYLIDLSSGVPVPIDVGSGAFPTALARPDDFFPNDPRAAEAQLLFESVDEDRDGDGELDPGEDSDFDGVLDRANTLDGRAGETAEETYDRTITFYERETNTLILRPLIPLAERTTYAVVLTDRLLDALRSPVRSPFDHVHHVSQRGALEDLPELLAARPHLYGDLAERGWDGVAFAWSFTTQSVTAELASIRAGLYGEGDLGWLAERFPPDFAVAPLRGPGPLGSCAPPTGNAFVATFDELRPVMTELAAQSFGITGADAQAWLATFDHVSHFVLGFVETPYFLGDPNAPRADARFPSPITDAARDVVPVLIVVPKESASHAQPFPVAFYGHGHTSSPLEGIGFAGLMARTGVATVAIAAEGHGFGLDPALAIAVQAIFASACLGPMGQAIVIDRARDLDADGAPDSGGQFWSAYLFHTRDAVRQSVVDHLQVLRVLRHFVDAPSGDRTFARATVSPPQGRALTLDGDLTGDGVPDRAGDFDLDGVADVGGWNGEYHAWGQSLGAILSGVLIGVEPSIRTAAPTSGAGGITDVAVRSTISELRNAVMLRIMGPLIVSDPESPGCPPGERRLEFVVPDLGREARVPIACVGADVLSEGAAVVARNLTNRQTRCAAVGASGALRIALPSDAGDSIVLTIADGADDLRYGDCTTRSGERLVVRDVIDTFRLEGRHQGNSFGIGDFLVAPAAGLGLARQTPAFRRFLELAQIAVEPADPINYVPRAFLAPLDDAPRSLLVAASIGDTDVPVHTAHTMARAAGLLPFVPADGPDELAAYRAPAWFEARYGVRTPHEWLTRFHVPEGVARLRRHPIDEVDDFLADVDDLSEGRARFDRDGSPVRDGGFATVRANPPLRWFRRSRGVDSNDDPYATSGPLSGLLHVMVLPRGNHGTEVPDVDKRFDEGVYFAHLVGRWMASGGVDLRYATDPAGHHCLEDTSCDFFEEAD